MLPSSIFLIFHESETEATVSRLGVEASDPLSSEKECTCLTGSSFFSAEEEINNMKSELEKYGIQMPAFSKIGGILANELSVDEAARKGAFLGRNGTGFAHCG